jgi:beta-xylosidase
LLLSLVGLLAFVVTLVTSYAMSEGDSFQNPVLRTDFPDPHIIRVDGIYYAYSTNAASRNVPVARSSDLVNWDIPSEALPGLGRWVRLGNAHVWAPEVMPIGERYIMYYTARHRDMDRQCIGVATSDEPDRGFQDTREEPLVCQVAEGGSIDAHPFRDDDGTLYLYWKNDGNHIGVASYIYVQALTPDGLELTGEPTRLIRNDQAWEGRVVEAPTMWLRDGRYHLFYSANSYAGVEYAVGYAVCESATGPCVKATENPILSSCLTPPLVIGPGHQAIVTDDAGQDWLVYHAWEVTAGGLRGGRRMMWLDRLDWAEGRPVVRGPTTEPQAKPVVRTLE